MSINRVMLSGNLTRDPELKSTAGGMSVLTFGIAVNERRKNNQTGEWEDKPNYFDVTVFGNRAEALSRYLSKGSKVSLEGRLQWHSWQDREGNNRSKVDVIAENVEFMSRQSDSKPVSQPYQPVPQPIPAQPVQEPYQAPQPAQQAFGADQYADDDIPF